MAGKNNHQAAKPKANKLVCCINCAHALLHRYGNNPILSACKQKPQQDNKRFPFEVQVASFLRLCQSWNLSTSINVVEQRSKVA